MARRKNGFLYFLECCIKRKKKVIWEVETGRLGIQDHSPLPWEFENSMGYLSLRLKKKKREKEGRRQKEEER